MKILIDPSMIWFNPYDENKFEYLNDVTSLIEKLLNVTHITSNIYINFLVKLMNDPFDEYRETYNKKNQIIRNLFDMLDTANIIDLDIYSNNNTLPSNFHLQNNEAVNNYFFRTLNYITQNNIECLFFLSLDNQNYIGNINANMHIIRHIYKEINSYLSLLISDGTLLKEDGIFTPTLSSPLPNKWLVGEYQEIRKDLIKKGKSSNTIFLDLGKEVAFRNGYIFDDFLTKINNNAIRNIFKSKEEPFIYLSTDVEHGAIEVFDYKPEHQGEYSYIGILKPNSKDTKKHKIKLFR